MLRQKGTEFPGTGEYNKHYPEEGTYNCVGCNVRDRQPPPRRVCALAYAAPRRTHLGLPRVTAA